MNESSLNPIFYAGELSLVLLIVILAVSDALKRPIFAVMSESSALELRNRRSTWLAAIGLAIVAVVYLIYGNMTSGISVVLFDGSINAGAGLYVGKIALIGAALLTVLISSRYVLSQPIPAMDYYLLLCFSLLGALTLIAAESFTTLFLAIEMMSIPIYALVGLKQFNPRAGESAIKYLLLGGFSSGFLLLGISFLYGATGTTGISEVLEQISFASMALTDPGTLLSALGLIFIFVGLAFKVSLVPFHAWTPDVYEGAATPITAFMSVAVKLAAFSVILKIFAGVRSFGPYDNSFSGMFAFFALLTIIYGNSVAIIQTNVKRLLAYSSIAHAGYMALALAPMNHSIEAIQAVLFYGIGYITMNMLAFGVLVYLTHQGTYCETLNDLKGIARPYPGAAAVMSIAMFSLAGLPPAVGFVGKVLIFMQLIKGRMYITAVIALIFSLIALYFYINVIVQMYMREPEKEIKDIGKKALLPVWITLGVTAILVILFGVIPSPLMDWSLQWAKMIF